MKSRATRSIAALISMLFLLGGLSLVVASPASASGCSIPPCGAVKNKTKTSVKIRWKNKDSDPWSTGWVAPGKTVGGFWNDKRDIDGFWAPKGCRTEYSTHAGAQYHVRNTWVKVSSNETATVLGVVCPG
ncbi:hypothetical protein [Kineosporia babensis]|uniref:Secreted protein n=1 Tax=Kineosporia babensis TaxID=499548 RepID=A0A9X1NBD8_9ACTN|nr:hypothetical protein [Kineosporia babensis]MCD5310605.1 hypothetical protein [Kineosporia babensis]